MGTNFIRTIDILYLMVSKNKKLTVKLLFILLLILPLSASASREYKITPTITDAYYTDLDNDGNQDDIRITVKLKIKGFEDKVMDKGVVYNVILGLVLPDKTEAWYILTTIATTTNLKLDFDMLNHATVSGWYQAYSIAYLQNYEQEKIEGHSVIFDPPGGQDGGDPGVKVAITSY